MNEKHLQLSIVVDEYGGVAGIVTIEDLLESIVGNMQDEFDHEEEEVTQLDEDSFEVDGTLSIDELGELLDRTFPEGDYDTVAGFLLDLLGHIPEEDEETVIEYEDLIFTVQQMDDRRIEQVLVCRVPIADDTADETE
jgi:putative hemolysin